MRHKTPYAPTTSGVQIPRPCAARPPYSPCFCWPLPQLRLPHYHPRLRPPNAFGSTPPSPSRSASPPSSPSSPPTRRSRCVPRARLGAGAPAGWVLSPAPVGLAREGSDGKQVAAAARVGLHTVAREGRCWRRSECRPSAPSGRGYRSRCALAASIHVTQVLCSVCWSHPLH